MEGRKFKPLIVVNDKDALKKFNWVVEESADLKKLLDSMAHKTTSYEEFQEEQRHSVFHAVIGYMHDLPCDEFEMIEDVFKHYSAAPVFSVVCHVDSDYESRVKEMNAGAQLVNSEGDKAEALIRALKWCNDKYTEIYNSDVVSSFKKFDKD